MFSSSVATGRPSDPSRALSVDVVPAWHGMACDDWSACRGLVVTPMPRELASSTASWTTFLSTAQAMHVFTCARFSLLVMHGCSSVCTCMTLPIGRILASTQSERSINRYPRTAGKCSVFDSYIYAVCSLTNTCTHTHARLAKCIVYCCYY
jgi:hypothetical protein